MAVLSTVAMLLSLAFNDSVSCVIQGQVWKIAAEETVSFTPGNFCTGIKITTDETQIVMFSPYRWVSVKIPIEKGHRRFQYRWGADVAHLEADTLPITWGNVNRG